MYNPASRQAEEFINHKEILDSIQYARENQKNRELIEGLLKKAEERLKAAYADWDASQTFFHTIMDHNELDEAENLFAGAFAVCREADGADFHMLLAQLMGQLRLLSETQSVSIKNVL